MSTFTLSVNGVQHRLSAEPEMPLLWALRDLLHLTGTKYGCGIGACGACTVHEDGKAVRSCQIQLSATEGKKYTTIEGLSVNGEHPCQKAWLEEDVSQCGYCQAGMIMEAAALVSGGSAGANSTIATSKSTSATLSASTITAPMISDEQIDAVFSDHVCRCGTYQRVRRAIHQASREVRGT